MAIGELDCGRCGAKLDSPRFEPVASRCTACGAVTTEPLPAGDQPTIELGWQALFRGVSWRDALLSRARGGGVVLGKCGRCEGPRVAPPGAALLTRCAHCGIDMQFPLDAHVPDAIPVARLSSAGLDLAWTPAHVYGHVDAELPCPGCGAPLPAFVGTHACAHCRAPLLALTSCGRRFVPGVRIQGTDDGQAVDAWWPLVAALEHYQRRLDLVEIEKRGVKRTLLVWLLLVVSMPLLFCGLAGVAAVAIPRFGPGGLVVLLMLAVLGITAIWIAVLVKPIIDTHRRRARIRAVEEELARGWRPRGVR